MQLPLPDPHFKRARISAGRSPVRDQMALGAPAPAGIARGRVVLQSAKRPGKSSSSWHGIDMPACNLLGPRGRCARLLAAIQMHSQRFPPDVLSILDRVTLTRRIRFGHGADLIGAGAR